MKFLSLSHRLILNRLCFERILWKLRISYTKGYLKSNVGRLLELLSNFREGKIDFKLIKESANGAKREESAILCYYKR